MAIAVCECEHDKRDHQRLSNSGYGDSYGPCKVCLCDSYKSSAPRVVRKDRMAPQSVVSGRPSD